ncbi:MAG: hypothetical protein RM021_001435 [Nostoc sp. EkiNYC01]|nr:hypothetical protein [Nostoc sp. EkiNYC01]
MFAKNKLFNTCQCDRLAKQYTILSRGAQLCAPTVGDRLDYGNIRQFRIKLSIDYTQISPPPALSDTDIEWMYKCLGKSFLG